MAMFSMVWLSFLILDLITGGATGQSDVSGARGLCLEPDNLIELYRVLRQQQIVQSSDIQDPRPSANVRRGNNSNGTSTRLVGHHHSGQRTDFSGVCHHCQAKDELNHDPTRIPRILAQTRCRRHRPGSLRWIGANYEAVCVDIYNNVRIKRRNGCLNGVYQYTDAWEAISIGCKCKVITKMVASH